MAGSVLPGRTRPPKATASPDLVEDREHHPGAEGVLQPVATVRERQAGVAQEVVGQSALPDQGVPVVGGPPEPELPRHVATDPPGPEVVARRPGVGRREQALVVPLDGLGHGLDQPLAALAVAPFAARRVAQRDAAAVGQPLDRSGEVEVLEILHEREHVAFGAAPEAVVAPDLLVDGEARRLLGVEGAQAGGAPTHPPQCDVLLHHVGQG